MVTGPNCTAARSLVATRRAWPGSQTDHSHESHVSVTAMDAGKREVGGGMGSSRATCEQLNDGGEAMTEARRGND